MKLDCHNLILNALRKLQQQLFFQKNEHLQMLFLLTLPYWHTYTFVTIFFYVLTYFDWIAKHLHQKWSMFTRVTIQSLKQVRHLVNGLVYTIAILNNQKIDVKFCCMYERLKYTFKHLLNARYRVFQHQDQTCDFMLHTNHQATQLPHHNFGENT